MEFREIPVIKDFQIVVNNINPGQKILDNYIYINSGDEYNLGSGATCKVKKITT
jgi:hypothetical protein